MATYAIWDDVVASYELPIPDEDRPRIERLLTRASARLTAIVPSIPARIGAGTLDPSLPNDLVVEAVLRAYRNPAGATMQGVGPFSRSFGRNAAHLDAVSFDPELVKAVLASPSDQDPGVGTFQMGRPTPQVDYTALDAVGGYRYIPESSRPIL